MAKLDLANMIVRRQVIPVVVANPTAANALVEASIKLDPDYDRIVGISYFEVANGGVAHNYNVGARTNRKQWIDDIPIDAWVATAPGPDDKDFSMNIPYGSGDTFYARVTPLALTNAAMSGFMVITLVQDLTEQPK